MYFICILFSSFKTTGEIMTQSLYERLGGAEAVNAAVDIFYRKMLSDDRVNYFFAGVDMTQQIQKQKSFLTMVFGGNAATLHWCGLPALRALRLQ